MTDRRTENVCDACVGTGKPISGLSCMCGGTGKMSDAARWLREQLVAKEAESERYREAIRNLRSLALTHVAIMVRLPAPEPVRVDMVRVATRFRADVDTITNAALGKARTGAGIAIGEGAHHAADAPRIDPTTHATASRLQVFPCVTCNGTMKEPDGTDCPDCALPPRGGG